MSIKDIILKGFKTTHANMSLLLTLFLYNIVLAVIAILIMGRNPMPAPTAVGTTPAVAGAVLIKGLIYNIVSLLLWVFVQGGILHLLRSAVADETGKDLGLFWEGGQKYYIPLLILTAILIIPLGILMAIMAGVGGAVAGGAAAGLSLLLILMTVLFIAYVIYLVFAMFSPYEVVVGEKDAISSIKSSLSLVAGNFWRTLGLLALLILVGVGVGLIIGVIMGVVNFVLKGATVITTILTIGFTSIINAYVIMIVTAALMAFYLSITGQKAGAETPKI